jgi:hypothetical protein
MTPSEAHEVAINREAGHDQMQAAILRYLKTKPDALAQWSVRGKYSNNRKMYLIGGVEAEAFYSGKFGVTFVDVLLRYVDVEKDARGHDLVSVYDVAFELKPKIFSAAAVKRQCTLMAHRMAQWSPPSHWREYGFTVYPLVNSNDQNLDDLLLVSSDRRVATWDGAAITWRRAND